jgi:two-component system sensor histidine kinase RstB
MILILLALVASFFLAGYIFHKTTVRQWQRVPPDFARFAGAVIDATTAGMSPEALTAMVERLKVERAIAIEIAPSDDPGFDPEITARLARGEPAVSNHGRQVAGRWHDEGLVVFVPVEGGRRTLIIGPHLPTLPEWETWLMILLAIAAVISLAAALIFWPVVRRLRSLERAAKSIAAGDLAARTDVRSRDAVGSLASTFNEMANRIQELLEKQRQLVQAVAHELRTPIARIRFGLEMIDRAVDPTVALERRTALDADLGELDGLVEELLVYSRYDSGRARLEPLAVDPRAVARDGLARVSGLYPGLAFDVSSAAAVPDSVTVDPRSFERVLGNLVSNAARHARSRVEVRLGTEPGRLTVEVHDDGTGIAEKDRRRVLEPFVRLDDSRSRASGGAGLGLAIVERALRANGGEVRIDTSDLGGVRVVTSWPR